MKQIIGYDRDGHTIYEDLGLAIGKGRKGDTHKHRRARSGAVQIILEKLERMSSETKKEKYIRGIKRKNHDRYSKTSR